MPRGIVGSERGGVLTNQLKDNPYCVVLLDEVEKASPNTLNLFLQAFDEGWMTDGRGKRVYLSDAVDHHDVEHRRRALPQADEPDGVPARRRSASTQVEGEVMRELERRFPPEFRNRIDEVVLFAPLTHDEVREIARHYLAAGRRWRWPRPARRSRSTTRRSSWSSSKGYSMAFGARFLKRFIDEHIKLPISAQWKDGSHFDVKAKDGRLVVEPGSRR